jgi:hypothetical protein
LPLQTKIHTPAQLCGCLFGGVIRFDNVEDAGCALVDAKQRSVGRSIDMEWNGADRCIDAGSGPVKLPITKHHIGERRRLQCRMSERRNAAQADGSAANSTKLQRIILPMRVPAPVA